MSRHQKCEKRQLIRRYDISHASLLNLIDFFYCFYVRRYGLVVCKFMLMLLSSSILKVTVVLECCLGMFT